MREIRWRIGVVHISLCNADNVEHLTESLNTTSDK